MDVNRYGWRTAIDNRPRQPQESRLDYWYARYRREELEETTPPPYRSLKHSDSCRLFYLQAGAFEDPLQGKLVEHRLHTTLAYDALSYTWGDSRDCKDIYVREQLDVDDNWRFAEYIAVHGPAGHKFNGGRITSSHDVNAGIPDLRGPDGYSTKGDTTDQDVWGVSLESTDWRIRCSRVASAVPVTINLYNALKRLRLPGAGRWLWIDAICVNQRNRLEREKQVLLMGRIFRTAKRVIVWLGEPRRLVPKLDQAPSKPAYPRLKRSPECLRSALESALAITQPPWWQRAWTVQEYTLAYERPMFVCGPCNFSIESLADLLQMRVTGDLASLQKAVARLEGLRNQAERLRELDTYDVFSLVELHDIMCNVSSTDPRDKVYGMLGLIKKPMAEAIKVDYMRWRCTHRYRRTGHCGYSASQDPGERSSTEHLGICRSMASLQFTWAAGYESFQASPKHESEDANRLLREEIYNAFMATRKTPLHLDKPVWKYLMAWNAEFTEDSPTNFAARVSSWLKYISQPAIEDDTTAELLPTGRMLVSTEGYLAIAWKAVRSGDVICILDTLTTPAVLRECGPRKYRFLGFAHVQGLDVEPAKAPGELITLC
ncbi:hypothetical protein LTR86_000157 [Recurvomyces mirabilis]|nr:hypothetical protein LTR86_000157 [Recurvomyces mirabilis]